MARRDQDKGRRARGRRDLMPPLKQWRWDHRTGMISWRSSSGAHYVLTPDRARRKWAVEVAYTVPLLRLLGITSTTTQYITTTAHPGSAMEAAKRHYAGVESRYTAAHARGWRVPMSMPADWIGWR